MRFEPKTFPNYFNNNNILLNENIAGQYLINANASNIGSGDVDFYTCPAGKKAFVSGVHLYNTAWTTTTFYFQLKVSWSYYKLCQSTTIATLVANATTNVNQLHIVLNAGESASINTTQAWLNIFPQIIEFNDTAHTISSRVLSVASGDNTVYTAPAWKTGFLYSAGLIRNGTGVNWYINTSGGTRAISWHVSSNTSSSTANKQNSASVTNGSVSSLISYMLIPPTYSLVLNTDGAGWTAWVNVLEI